MGTIVRAIFEEKKEEKPKLNELGLQFLRQKLGLVDKSRIILNHK